MPELQPAQILHDLLVRRHGWVAAFNAFRASLITCTTLSYRTSSPEHVDPWAGRLAQLIPKPRASYSNTRYIAAFYPEAIQLMAVMLSKKWRPHIEQAATSRLSHHPPSQVQEAVTREVNRALGRPPSFDTTSVINHIDTWMHAATARSAPQIPNYTFLDTRRSTMDGIAIQPWTTPTPRSVDQRLRKARTEYSKHGHVPDWALILAGHRHQ